ncbi:UDP-glucose 4-epimerase GalE [Candidatus Daviesbacteria bacterium RIFCSPHIGHO2_01_FULL_40_11]|uniref:UDP-glucose 4-epimerase n=1 Tax=Candidatus Daviesbacteria bacterium RIFCSPHIGHO2_01_FULL_40_11 TaxID=1797762 RepID=A0A1F5JHN2_9BACT|nr:MAG: UDP-glucose 4-epimerase GalE [Candidatus Daviesbacteria bacterium RIFCSPHIGHO2_01_FULL_40_11]OGE63093.1 MAG: UDP-glucose 4-epimerase GalE [Candidatus Daviesbacteria bacterium RIFCSPLOWO2_01_FULL_40_27]
MRVLVTGGAGFIGSHVNKLLLDQGHSVTVVDDLSKGHQDSIDARVDFHQIGLENQEELEKILPGHDGVIHMASFIEVGESVKKPVEFAQNNIVGTVKLLEAMKNANVKKMIFSSSACVYGKPEKLPITEEDPLGEQENPYGITKVTMEEFCKLFHTLHNFDVTILRYFNPYGPGELHEPETHAIPNFVKSALTKTPIPLFWKGEQIRDFIFIDDLAQAHILALTLTGLHIYNVGTESGVKVADVVKQIFEIVGYEVPIDDKGERKGDVPALVASSEKLKKELGWNAKVNLEEGLKKTIEFFKNQNL